MAAEGGGKKRQRRCHVEGCRGRVVMLVGDCRWCRHSHCQEHRLPEAHGCERLADCSRAAREHNAERLKEGHCVAAKLASSE